MDQFLTRVWEDLLGRTEGSLTLRLLLQPVVSAILAIRAGLKDAREGRPPYFWALAFNPDHRHQLLRQGWKDTGKIYVIAVILDVGYQLTALHTVYPGEALLVGCLLAVVPYLLIRAPVTRLAYHHREQPWQRTPVRGTRSPGWM